jgi:hypothetical protein
MNNLFFVEVFLIIVLCILTIIILLNTKLNKFLSNKKTLFIVLLTLLIIIILKSNFISCDDLSNEQRCVCKILYNKKNNTNLIETIDACKNFKK